MVFIYSENPLNGFRTMSEETKGVEVAPEIAPSQETAQGEELKTTEPVSNSVDYDAVVAQLTEERDNYKQGMLNAKAKNKELKETQETVAPEPVVDLDEVAEKAAQIAREQVESFKSELTADTLEEALIQSSDSPGVRKVIRYHYENSLNKSGHSRGAILADVKKAAILANNNLATRENEELKEALKAKNSTTSAPQFSGQKEAQPEPDKLSNVDKSFQESFRRHNPQANS